MLQRKTVIITVIIAIGTIVTERKSVRAVVVYYLR